jgi:hypothetical protein
VSPLLCLRVRGVVHVGGSAVKYFFHSLKDGRHVRSCLVYACLAEVTSALQGGRRLPLDATQDVPHLSGSPRTGRLARADRRAGRLAWRSTAGTAARRRRGTVRRRRGSARRTTRCWRLAAGGSSLAGPAGQRRLGKRVRCDRALASDIALRCADQTLKNDLENRSEEEPKRNRGEDILGLDEVAEPSARDDKDI